MRRIATAVLTATAMVVLGGRPALAEEGAGGGAPAAVDLKLPTADAASIAAQGEAKAAAGGTSAGAATEPAKDAAKDAAKAPAGDAPGGDEGGKKKIKTAKATSPVKGGETTEEKLQRLKETFATFCDDWVGKLRERQRNNLAHITWRTSPEGVVGEYVGYDTDHMGPQTVEHPDATPIGKLVYLELKLRLSGPTEAHALAKEPEVIERTEVTELFRFNQGAWVY